MHDIEQVRRAVCEQDAEKPGNDTSGVTIVDRARCFCLGHDVRCWGTLLGWCQRCKHTISRGDGKSVFRDGLYYRFPPAH